MPDIHFDRYYHYDDLTRLLHDYAREYPALVQVESIGKSYEERDIWLATVTAGGAHDEKPALWVNGNIHASEVSATSVCLYLIETLVRGYGSDVTITRCLDTRTFYICPRPGPDGSELALAEHPKIVRSSTRAYPFDEDPIGGLVSEDIDDDGRILMMRIPDPNGEWKAHTGDPRLMVRRDPVETGGTYYRIFSEGLIEDYDGILIAPQKSKQGLDLNRNFPAQWRQEFEQTGAGPYPTSEPEVRAYVDFVAQHKNITGAVDFHTWSGVLLRPFSTQSDDGFATDDLWTFQKLGAKGTEVTGYPAVSLWHEFRYHPKQVLAGGSIDWMFEHLGIFSWAVEIWSPQRQAGITDYKYIDWFREHPVEDDLKLLKWSDEVLDGKGYVAWYPFDHPQLGKVELGGWDHLYAWRNPPPQFLEKEIAPFADWLVWLLLISPRLELYDVAVTPLGDDSYHVRLVVQNTGWLPSYVSKQALNRKLVRGVLAEIELPDGATLTTGKRRMELSQLEGRAYKYSAMTPWNIRDSNTNDRALVEWVIHAPNGGTATLTARHDRAGVVRATVDLK
ncbi:MAG: M14 family metallopeptidase [Anaerolineae bacterium]